ncbi:hypothetical protein NQ317_009328 [Molorchus minor]|uniref:Uncharacterized protein n=1 Tax=Molorchus minor TaxID=1323400 RepID=A0ABQ9JGZ3_9CUCU|nr:hypothetical protein NQ317_009328 [Molorchus minor]
MFASVGSVLKLHTWSDNQLEQISTFNPKRTHGRTNKIGNLSWCHDNSYIALLIEGSQPQIVSSKDRTNINLVHTINALKDVTACTFKNHTKRNIALGNKSGDIILYDTKSQKCSLDDQLAVLCNSLSVFSDRDGAFNFSKELHEPSVPTTIKYHPTITNLIAVGGENGTVALWDIEKEEKLLQLRKHSSAITGVSFTVSQRLMVTTGMDNKICILDNASSDCLFRMNIHQPVTAIDISPDDMFIAVGLEDGCVCIYDIRDPLRRLVCSKSHNFPINKIAFERGPIIIESLHDGHSFTTLNDSEFGENSKSASYDIPGVNVENGPNEGFEEKLKRDVMKMVKGHMAYLENQLAEHCSKFQSFISNEFDSIHNAMARWDVFNIQDAADVANAIENNETKSMKSTSTRKATNYQLPV